MLACRTLPTWSGTAACRSPRRSTVTRSCPLSPKTAPAVNRNLKANATELACPRSGKSLAPRLAPKLNPKNLFDQSGRRDLNRDPLTPRYWHAHARPSVRPGQQAFISPQRFPVACRDACPLLYLAAVQRRRGAAQYALAPGPSSARQRPDRERATWREPLP